MAYSAVSHPRPLPRKKGGAPSSTEAVHNTCVRPHSMSTLPAAICVKSGKIRTGLNCFSMSISPFTAYFFAISLFENRARLRLQKLVFHLGGHVYERGHGQRVRAWVVWLALHGHAHFLDAVELRAGEH